METTRRRFLSYLAGSPLLVAAGIDLTRLHHLIAGSLREQSAALDTVQQAAQERAPIASPREAFNVLDFEAAARKSLPPAHWGYLATGVDDDATVHANREGFSRYALRMRRLVDIGGIDTSISMFGVKWETPILLCPVGSQKAFHPEGEIAVARAAKAKKHLQTLSTFSTTSYEDASAAHGMPLWFQLYSQTDWNKTLQIIKRVERAGCPAIAFTIDTIGGGTQETMLRAASLDERQCGSCHFGNSPGPGIGGQMDRTDQRKPMVAEATTGTPIREKSPPTWEYVRRLKDATNMKLLLKGIVTREDARLAMRHGVDGIWVSNHGGRADNSERATILCLPEVAAIVAGRVPLIVDSGFRRGTDMFKGLALGATAVGVGRPYVWGLASFGQEGVETVLTLLRNELRLVMRQAGTQSIRRIGRGFVVPRGT